MGIIEQPSQYIFLIGFILLLIFYILIIYAERRAVFQTKLPLPFLVKYLMELCLYFIFLSILFVLLVKP